MNDARLWKNLTTAISTLTEEARFKINFDEIKLREMDPSHVAMVDFEWPKKVFDEYVCTKATNLCINVNEMHKLLGRVGSDESIELTLDEETNRLKIRLKGSYTRTFNIPTLESLEDEVPAPKISFDAKVRLTSRCLRKIVVDALTVSDHVQLKMTKEEFTMEALGGLGDVLIQLPKESEVVLDFDIIKNSKAIFSLSYLSEIIKSASTMSDLVTLEFSTNMPIRLNFELPHGGKLQYYLAPRIENT